MTVARGIVERAQHTLSAELKGNWSIHTLSFKEKPLIFKNLQAMLFCLDGKILTTMLSLSLEIGE